VLSDSVDDGVTFGELLWILRAHRGGRRSGWGGKRGGRTEGRYRLLPVSFLVAAVTLRHSCCQCFAVVSFKSFVLDHLTLFVALCS